MRARSGSSFLLAAPGILLVAHASGWFGSEQIARILALEIGLWAIVLLLVVIIYRGERRDVRSIGLDWPRPASLAWGMAAAAVVVLICFLVATALDLAPPSAKQLSSTGGLPLWLRLFMLLTAACTEEVLCRVYPMTRLEELTRSRAIAAGLPLLVFILYHFPFQGPGHIMFVTVLGTVLTVLFLVRRDLWSNVTAHFALDVPFILLPLLTSRLAP